MPCSHQWFGQAYLRRADAFMHTDETCHAAEAAMLAHALDPRHTEVCARSDCFR
jgi:hypothetical protein